MRGIHGHKPNHVRPRKRIIEALDTDIGYLSVFLERNRQNVTRAGKTTPIFTKTLIFLNSQKNRRVRDFSSANGRGIRVIDADSKNGQQTHAYQQWDCVAPSHIKDR